MSTTIWGKFYWSDYASDEALKMCSLAAQGLWMRMLCTMAGSEPYGYLTINGHTLNEVDLAKLYAVAQAEVGDAVAELDRYGVFSRDAKGRIYSRRMVRDAKKAATARKNGKRGGNPSLGKQKENQLSDKGEDKSGDKPHIPEARSQKPDEDNKSSLPVDDPIEAEFEEWYSRYPRKVAKPSALKAYRRARKKASASELLVGIDVYRATKPDYADYAHPATWLNGERWLDEPPKRENDEPQGRDPGSFAREDWLSRISNADRIWPERYGTHPRNLEGTDEQKADYYLGRHAEQRRVCG